MPGPGFQWFVAWRYLMARPRRLSGIILVFAAAFAWLFLGSSFGLAITPATDSYVAAGLPVPWWLPVGMGAMLAVPLVLLLVGTVRAGWYRPLPDRELWRTVVLGAMAAGCLLVFIGLGERGELEPIGIVGALLIYAAPLVILAIRPAEISTRVIVVSALAGIIAVALVVVVSLVTEHGALLENVPGLIGRDPPWATWSPWLPVGAAVLVGVAALVRADVAARGYMRLAALILALAPTALALVIWYRIAAYGAYEITRPGLAVQFQLPVWLTIPAGIGAAFLVLTLVLLAIRYFFTFFTTVSMGGVAIGTMALVITLSVMSGFENDLRDKILGSNAHILITRDDDAPFTGYRPILDRARKVSGVAGVNPYLTSEVVLAGSTNYFNVVIKGVDPARISSVTDLGSDLEDSSALQKLWPMRDDGGLGGPPPDAGVDQQVQSSAIDAADPAPDDLDIGVTDPIDWSGGLTESPDIPDASVPDAGTDAGAGSDLWGDGGAGSLVPGEGLQDLSPERPEWQDVSVEDISPDVAVLPGVLVGRELVKQISLYVGQEVRVISPLGQNTIAGQTPYIKPYRVAGVFYTGMYEYDLKWVYVELSTLQDFLDLPDVVTGIEIRVADPDATEQVVAALRDLLGSEYRIQDWKEINRSLFSALKLEKIAMFLVLAIIILVASFSIVGNLIMVVVEKAREIAVLKTLGASDGGVTRIFVVQGFFIGLVGTSIGVTLGLLACYLAETYGIGIPPDVYYIDRLPIHVEMTSVLLVAGAGLLISVAATLYPARIAARLRPVQGLRYE